MKKMFSRGVSAVVLIAFIIAGPFCGDHLYFSHTVFAYDDPLNLESLVITEDTTWNSDTDLSVYNNVYVYDDATLTIEAGSTIAMRNVYVWDRSNIVAQGTSQKPITITQLPVNREKDGDYDPECIRRTTGTITFETDTDNPNESLFSYVTFEEMGTYIDMENGGYTCPALTKNDSFFPSLINTAYAAQPAEYYDPYDQDPIKSSPAIYYESGRVTMTNCTFKNNEFADVLANVEIYEDVDRENNLTIKNSNFGTNKMNIAVRSRVVDVNRYYEYFDEQYDLCLSTFPPLFDWWVKYQACSLQATAESDNNETLFDDGRITLTNNWYGHENGPDTSYIEWGGQGDRVYGNLTFNGSRPTPDMASNVLFLPGIKASRLDLDSGDQIWLPEKEGDTHYLGMSNDGESANNIHAKNIVEDAYGLVPVYDEFVEDLNDLKSDHVITDFSLFAYDWRYGVDDIAKNGTKYPNGEIKKPIDEIWRLAESSVSGKVTIVAHSNGGLLAKAIMQELERQMREAGMDNAEMPVDNIITVSAPQMGTPKAIGSLLHGYDEKIGKSFVTLMSDEQSRMLAEDMPGAYGLLPSKEYFTRTQDPLINFDATIDPYKKYKEVYGKEIENFDEFRKFALAKEDHRDKPEYDDLTSANVLNENIFDQATEMHDRIDVWTPPENVKLIQIGGWGLDTVRSFTYTMKAKEECDIDLHFYKGMCQPTGEYESFFEPNKTVDGDETVITPSSLMLPVADNVERYWVDLFRYNRSYLGSTINRNHKDILEVHEVRSIISDYIKKHVFIEELPEYISQIRPEEHKKMKNPIRIRMSLYSPLDIHLYDENGNHTGPVTEMIDGEEQKMIEENIPNSYYETIGDHKYVGWGTDDEVRVELDGYGVGSYTIKLQEVFVTDDGEENGDSTELTSLPTSDKTMVRFTVPAEGIQDISDLTADYDGDGTIDYTITPQINGSASLPEESNDQKDDTEEETSNDTKKERKKEYKKASITNWSAYQYETKSESCPTKLKLTLTGKHFDKDAIIRIGDVKAKKVVINNNKKLTATFCVKDLQRVKTESLRTISVQNLHTKREKSNKKIDLNNFLKK